MMQVAPPPPPKQKFPVWILIPIAIAICAMFTFLAIWQFLTPSERRVQVAYSDFIAEVHAGRVDEIRIRDREITYRAHDGSGHPSTRETTGPIPDEALVASLKPDDPNLPLPKIYFER